jgi:hypothetical protein
MLFFKILTILIGATISGEALALTMGVHLLGDASNPWITPSNNIMLIADMLTGAGLIYVGISADESYNSVLFWVFAGVALISHGFREWEYLAVIENKFCGNLPLFIVNNVKLAGLIAISITLISLSVRLDLYMKD